MSRAQEHYEAATRLMAGHDTHQGHLTTQQSTESATWVIAHALLGLLAAALEVGDDERR